MKLTRNKFIDKMCNNNSVYLGCTTAELSDVEVIQKCESIFNNSYTKIYEKAEKYSSFLKFLPSGRRLTIKNGCVYRELEAIDGKLYIIEETGSNNSVGNQWVTKRYFYYMPNLV